MSPPGRGEPSCGRNTSFSRFEPLIIKSFLEALYFGILAAIEC